MTRGIVTVGTSDHFIGGVERLKKIIGDSENIHAHYDFPSGSPTHQEIPYAFKPYAIEQAPFDLVLWCDSSIIPLRPLNPIWKLIETQGYWFSRNYDYTNGEFCCDDALPILGATREESFKIPHVVATCFGLNMRDPVARYFLSRWKALAQAFKGPWRNDSGEASSDPRVRGHRHDQSAASVVAYRLEMRLTDPPDYFAEQGFPTSPSTILTVHR